MQVLVLRNSSKNMHLFSHYFPGCNSNPADMDVGFPQFGAALLATGRPMVYQCEWPLYQGSHGIKPNYTAIRKHCNLWRNFDDIQDNWDVVQK